MNTLWITSEITDDEITFDKTHRILDENNQYIMDVWELQMKLFSDQKVSVKYIKTDNYQEIVAPVDGTWDCEDDRLILTGPQLKGHNKFIIKDVKEDELILKVLKN